MLVRYLTTIYPDRIHRRTALGRFGQAGLLYINYDQLIIVCYKDCCVIIEKGVDKTNPLTATTASSRRGRLGVLSNLSSWARLARPTRIFK